MSYKNILYLNIVERGLSSINIILIIIRLENIHRNHDNMNGAELGNVSHYQPF